MKKTIAGVFKLGAAVVLALAVGVGAVFALNQPDSGVTADSVAVLKSQGITCGSCAGKIEKALKEKPGVAAVEVDVDTGRVIVTYDAKVAKPDTLAQAVSALGYASAIQRTMSAEQYRATTGGNVAARTAKAGGCGGGCCNKNRN